MALLSLGGVCLLLRYLAAASGDDVPVISLTKNESSQVLLDCSLGSEGIRVKKFDWKVNGTKEVFLYDGGDVYTEGTAGQDPQFKGRVQHKSLDSSNASIIISNALVKDTGIYECIYIDETNQKTTKSRISLTVGCILKDRTEEKINGSCSEPYIVVSQEDDVSNLQCDVRGAFPKPAIEWQDSAGQPIDGAVETKFEQKEDGQFYITVKISVTQDGIYRCVITQQEICHQTQAETKIVIKRSTTGLIIGLSVGLFVAVVVVVVVVSLLVYYCRKERNQTSLQMVNCPNTQTQQKTHLMCG